MERDFLSRVEQQLSRNNQHRHLLANVDTHSLHKEVLGGKQKKNPTHKKREREHTFNSLKPFG